MDWWQAILVLLAGGLISGVTAYATQHWTTSAGRDAEERQAKRRLEEEQRQAIRQLRRERIQPVLDFLDIVKQSVASQAVGHVIDNLYESPSPERKLSAEEWQTLKSDLLEAEPPTLVQRLRAFTLAVQASVSVPVLQHELIRLYTARTTHSDPKLREEFGPALRSVEQLIEQYLAGGEP